MSHTKEAVMDKINQNVQIILALRSRILMLEELQESLRKGGHDHSVESRAIADCKAVLDGLNAAHYEG